MPEGRSKWGVREKWQQNTSKKKSKKNERERVFFSGWIVTSEGEIRNGYKFRAVFHVTRHDDEWVFELNAVVF